MREVPLERFAAARADGACVVDVREPAEYVAGHVPGGRLLPADTAVTNVHVLPRRKPVYVVCASGNRSRAVAEELARAGLDAWSVAGGTSAWQQAGLPVVRGPRADVA